ncbi:DMT family transporter [Ramlibacter tataouinensis]|uniref:Candidate transporter n=1 Tax=Ramlibacter tataouinensis (strain ATCC BAA-407 / DSM 14655 / LMG 21543 / TTB310) TaxID=365046 RepID=F5Y3D6_RAMTT|nr:DMT family transporter [Ramlibacter tataouinensis]AEG91223.1 Candidate transporter [Ramlibacter tataouinensis TTB310]
MARPAPARNAPATPEPAVLFPVLALVFNAFVWGVAWWPLRELHARGVHPLWGTAAVFLLALACVLATQRGAWRPLGRQPLLWLLAVATGMTNLGFNWAVTVGDVVRVVLLFYLMPAWSVLLAWALLGERPTAASLLRLGLALAGVAVVLHPGDGGWPWPRGLADGLALLGGFSFALTNILLRRLREVPAPARVVAMFGGGAATALAASLLGTAQGLLAAPAVGPAAAVLVAALAAGFLCSNVALQYGAARLPAHTTALVMLSEVVFASLSSIALGAAEPGWRTGAGGALILAAAAWSAWPTGRAPARAGAQSAP